MTDTDTLFPDFEDDLDEEVVDKLVNDKYDKWERVMDAQFELNYYGNLSYESMEGMSPIEFK